MILPNREEIRAAFEEFVSEEEFRAALGGLVYDNGWITVPSELKRCLTPVCRYLNISVADFINEGVKYGLEDWERTRTKH